MDDSLHDPITESLKQTRGAFIRTSILLFIYALIVAGSPYLLVHFFNHVINGVPTFLPDDLVLAVQRFGLSLFESEALLFAGALVILGFISAWLSKLEETAPLACALAVVSDFRQKLLFQVLHGKLSYLDSHSARELSGRIGDDALVVESLLVSSLKAFAKSLPLLIFMVLALAVNSQWIALVFVAATVPFYAVAASYVRADWVRSKRSDFEIAHYRHEIQHSLLMLPSLKSLSAEDEALDLLSLRAARSDEQALLSRRARGSLAGTVAGAKHILRAALLVFGAWLLAENRFFFGPFLLFAIYIELMPAPVLELARCVALAKSAAPSLERLRGLATSLENGEEIEGARKTSSLPFPDAGNLVFEEVALKPGGTKFSAEFEPGELIGVVGFTGRSTFGRLLNRLADPAEGVIQIGRTQLKRYSLDLLRQTVTVVDRFPYFMTASIRENLALAIERETDLDERNVNEALTSAAVDFIGELPEKLDTVIGETAYRLSESEALRLGVARAFLRTRSQIFFFDDVTAGLEAGEARTIFESAQALAEQGAIVFWVTRRTDEAAECDRIVYLEATALEDGRPDILVTVDTNDALLADSTAYRKVLGVRESRLISRPNDEASVATPPARGRETEINM